MRAKAKKTPMCSVSLIAIELKGLAAPGEALKNNMGGVDVLDVQKNNRLPPEAACRSNVVQSLFIFDPQSPYNDPPKPQKCGFGLL